ncbi:MAG: glycosyltransferase [Gemmatimonadota bacterium]|jgi:glycosyltransferase involved in cell wall biosynthesis|nr:glycosyltransferase [Gemmatimonadota bacterium]
MRRQRILHLIDTGGPGGAETVLVNLVAGLGTERWEHHVAVPLRDWLYNTLEERDIPVTVLPSEGAFDVRYLRGIIRTIRDLRIDIIQTHLFTSAVYGAVAGVVTGVPIVSTIHGIVDTGPDNLKRKVKFRIINRSRNRIVLVSRLLKDALAEQARLREKIQTVIHNGIDTTIYHPARDTGFRQELNLPEDAILIGALGNVRVPKDYGNLLNAAAILKARSSRYHVAIVGDTEWEPELYQELLARRAELGLEKTVTFTGFRPDTARLLNNFDLYVMSSEREGLPLALAQGMSTGLPVVSTRAGGAQELITSGRDGLLVPVRDPVALADAIDSLARDPSRMAEFGFAARRTIEENFAIGKMVARYEGLYHELLGITPSAGV